MPKKGVPAVIAAASAYPGIPLKSRYARALPKGDEGRGTTRGSFRRLTTMISHSLILLGSRCPWECAVSSDFFLLCGLAFSWFVTDQITEAPITSRGAEGRCPLFSAKAYALPYTVGSPERFFITQAVFLLARALTLISFLEGIRRTALCLFQPWRYAQLLAAVIPYSPLDRPPSFFSVKCFFFLNHPYYILFFSFCQVFFVQK